MTQNWMLEQNDSRQGRLLARPAQMPDSPRIYISHGIDDRVLPVERCSRRIVAQLRRYGYDVYYEEIDDGHTVPAPIVANAFAWFMGTMDERVQS